MPSMLRLQPGAVLDVTSQNDTGIGGDLSCSCLGGEGEDCTAGAASFPAVQRLRLRCDAKRS